MRVSKVREQAYALIVFATIVKGQRYKEGENGGWAGNACEECQGRSSPDRDERDGHFEGSFERVLVWAFATRSLIVLCMHLQVAGNMQGTRELLEEPRPVRL